MIKVGIIGGHSQIAGELIRLLVLHPDVELLSVYSPQLKGMAISSHHKGIIGETDLRFSDSIDLKSLDALFVTVPAELKSFEMPIQESLKVIVIQDKDLLSLPGSLDELEFIPGVSEMFRKPLVRGGKAAKVLPSPVSVALIALFPLALHLLLNDSLEIRANLPKNMEKAIGKEAMTMELEILLKKVQLSFNKIKQVEIANSNLQRTISLEIEFDCNISEEEIERIYNQTYDDHNFTFLMRTDPATTEVAGTQKCLLYITKPSEGRVRVKALADSFLRGGAGDAIHAMNLLFGLYEKTGLSFPATMAFRTEESRPEEI